MCRPRLTLYSAEVLRNVRQVSVLPDVVILVDVLFPDLVSLVCQYVLTSA